jgi:hypothetical protein
MRVRRILRLTLIVALAQLVTGITVGAGARLAMRIVALTDDSPGTVFTAGGTLVILLAVAVVASPLAVVFVSVRRFVSGSDLRRGVKYGAGIAVPGLLIPAGEAFQIGIVPLNVLMFGGLFVLYGVLLSVSIGALERRIRRPGRRRAEIRPWSDPPLEAADGGAEGYRLGATSPLRLVGDAVADGQSRAARSRGASASAAPSRSSAKLSAGVGGRKTPRLP